MQAAAAFSAAMAGGMPEASREVARVFGAVLEQQPARPAGSSGSGGCVSRIPGFPAVQPVGARGDYAWTPWGIWTPGSRVGRSPVWRQSMGIGVSIFLIALGAILVFATDVSVSGLSLDAVGVILMVVGALGLVMTLLVWGPRRRVAPAAEVVEERRVAPPREIVEERRVAPPREVVEERRTYEDPTL